MSRNAVPQRTKPKRGEGARREVSALFYSLALLIFGFTLAAAPAADAKKSLVVVVHSSQAVQTLQPQPETIRAMVSCGLTNVTGRSSERDAWRSLISTNDVVGIKVFSAPGPNSGTRPSVVEALVSGLLGAGVSPRNMIIWDREGTDLRLSGFVDAAQRLGVRVEGSIQAGYDPNAFYDTALLGTPVWGDLEFGKKGVGVGRKSFVTKILTSQVTKIINVTPLLNHDLAGVCGNLYSLAIGSVDNTGRFEASAESLAAAVPEIFALTNLSDHVVLNITDALLSQYEGSERGLLQYSTTLSELRFSKDAVALDVLSIKDLDRQRKVANAPTNSPKMDLYENAAILELGTADLKKIDVRRVELDR